MNGNFKYIQIKSKHRIFATDIIHILMQILNSNVSSSHKVRVFKDQSVKCGAFTNRFNIHTYLQLVQTIFGVSPINCNQLTQWNLCLHNPFASHDYFKRL